MTVEKQAVRDAQEAVATIVRRLNQVLIVSAIIVAAIVYLGKLTVDDLNNLRQQNCARVAEALDNYTDALIAVSEGAERTPEEQATRDAQIEAFRSNTRVECR